MPLLSLWQSNPAAITEFTVEQVVATSGDGNLKDASVCSEELRGYLAQIPSEKITSYVDQCLASSFAKSGMVLQDLVNELGRRLDYKVANGRYQGTTNAVGFDGLWVSPEKHTLVVEVKTTDAYRISLDTIANYRERLRKDGQIQGESSVLIVVGRQDTGELEAQVRGSRHAWDIRLISAEALSKLVALKESTDEPETGLKIRSILAPLEYTRLDRMVDVLFTAARDVEASAPANEVSDAAIVEEPSVAVEPEKKGWEFTDSALLNAKRDLMIAAVSKAIGAPLIKKSRAQFWSADHTKRVVFTISKKYSRSGYPYWYGYRPPWEEFLREGEQSYLTLGCMDLDVAFMIPWSVIHQSLAFLNMTDNERETFWHLHIVDPAPGKYELLLHKAEQNVPITPYQIDL